MDLLNKEDNVEYVMYYCIIFDPLHRLYSEDKNIVQIHWSYF